MRSLKTERLYHDLAERLRDLPADRRAAFQEGLQIMAEQEGQVTAALRQAIADSGLSVYMIAKEAGISTAPLYRFLDHAQQLKLSSVDAIARVLQLELKAAKRAKAKPAAAESEDELSRDLTRMVNQSVSAAKRTRKAAKG